MSGFDGREFEREVQNVKRNSFLPKSCPRLSEYMCIVYGTVAHGVKVRVQSEGIWDSEGWLTLDHTTLVL